MLFLSVQLMFCKHFLVMAVLPLKLCLPRCMRQCWSSKRSKLTGSRLPFYIFAQSSLKKSTQRTQKKWVREETVTATTLLNKHSIAKHLSFTETSGAGHGWSEVWHMSTLHVNAWAPRCGPFHAWWHFEALRPSTPAPFETRQVNSTGFHRIPQTLPARYSCWGEGWERANAICLESTSTLFNTMPFLPDIEGPPPAELPSWVPWQPRAKERCHASATHIWLIWFKLPLVLSTPDWQDIVW